MSVLDQELTYRLLSQQRDLSQVRGILEIGVFAGRSASVLALAAGAGESLYLCDPMEPTDHTPLPVDVPALDETIGWLATIRSDVTVVALPVRSADLDTRFPAASRPLRAIHVDGDHHAETVRQDLVWSAGAIQTDAGIIIIDDYRTAHTPGVAAAFWPWLLGLSRCVHAVVLSEHKAYVLLGKRWQGWDEERLAVTTPGWAPVDESILGIRSVRLARTGT